jgi:hypothetical protein
MKTYYLRPSVWTGPDLTAASMPWSHQAFNEGKQVRFFNRRHRGVCIRIEENRIIGAVRTAKFLHKQRELFVEKPFSLGVTVYDEMLISLLNADFRCLMLAFACLGGFQTNPLLSEQRRA